MSKDTNMPLVTVGIPTYNRAKGLERTLQCIMQQTYDNLEIIISDNCSTDPDVLSLLNKYAGQDSRIKFFVQEQNITLVPNFQFLLDKATGEYFMWAADDDQWDLNFIEVCVKGMLGDEDIILCMTDLKIVGLDDVGVVNKITSLISGDLRINISALTIEANDGLFRGNIKLFVHDKEELETLLQSLKSLPGIESVERYDTEDIP